MGIKSGTLFSAFFSFCFIALANAQTAQISLTINNTANTVYIPGTGELQSSSLGQPANYTAPKYFYLASYVNNTLSALVADRGNRLFTSNISTRHTIGIDQNAQNSKVLVVFSSGDWRSIDNKIVSITAGTFLSSIKPSFGFGLGVAYPIKMVLNYTRIDLQEEHILRKGRHGLLISYSEISGSRPAINVSRI